MADNILKGEIKITAPGLAQTVNEVTSSMDQMQKSMTLSNGIVVQAGLSWGQFKHAIKDATKEATGQILSCGEAAKKASPLWAEYKAAGMNAMSSIQKGAEGTQQSFTSLIEGVSKMAGAFAKNSGVVDVLQNKLQLFQQALSLEKNPVALNALNEGILEIQRSIIGLGGTPNPFTPIIQNGTIAGKSVDDFRAQIERLQEGLSSAQSVESFDRISRAIDTAKVKMELLSRAAQGFSTQGLSISSVQFPTDLVSRVQAFGGGVKSLTPAIASFNTAVQAIPAPLQRFGTQIEETGKRSYTARYAMQNLSDVIRDIPFAANNPAILTARLDHLVASFSMMSAEAGSAKGAMKNLLGSLAGTGGIMIGFNLAALAASYLIPKLAGVGDEGKKAADKLKETKQSLEDYAGTLKEIDQVQLKGRQSAQEEITKLSGLYQATQDVNIPLKKRKELVDQLQESFPKYFKNISDETILTGGAKQAYEQLANAIVAVAQAKAFGDEITDVQKQILASDKKVAEDRTTFLKTQATAQANTNTEIQRGIHTTGKFVEGQIDQITTSIHKGENKTKQAWDGFVGTIGENSGLKQRLQDLKDSLKKFVEENPDALIDPNKGGPTKAPKSKSQFNFFNQFFDTKPDKDKIEKQITEMAKVAREFASKNFQIFKGLDKVLFAGDDKAIVNAGKKFWADFQKGIITLKPQKINIEQEINLLPKIEDPLKEFNNDAALKHLQATLELPQETQKDILDSYKNAFAKIGQELPKYIDVLDSATGKMKSKPLQLVLDTDKTTGDLKTGLHKALGAALNTIDEVNKDINKALQQMATSLAGGFGEALGTALAGGDITKVFQGLGQTLGGVIQSLGEQMIALSPLIKAIQIAISSLNPALLLPAGIGMVALGSFIKGMFSAQKFAAGGFVPGSGNTDSVPAMLMPGEFVIPKDKVSDWLSIINSYGGKVKKYAAGGMVSSMGLSNAKYFASSGNISNIGLAPLQVSGQFELSGRNLVAVFSQELKHQGRNF